MNNVYQVTRDVPTIQKIVDGDVVWKLTGEQIDELLQDIKRMENMLVDLVLPEEGKEDCGQK